MLAGLAARPAEARRLRILSANMVAFRVALYLVMLSAVAIRERLHAVLRGPR
jgi:hypothetical protein